jgi:hypothetical protein
MDRHIFTRAAFALGMIVIAGSPAIAQRISFDMVKSAAVATCLPIASARVTVEATTGTAEDITIHATGLPSFTDFDFFVIQVPTAPFGLSWYQGDLQTDSFGEAFAHFRGRFSIETFIVAPGTAPAPVVFNGPFPDASSNPPTNPVHTYHLGLWFNSPTDAANFGCPGTVTPFNGEHNAGIQVLNTSNFPNDFGPLRCFPDSSSCPLFVGFTGSN